MTAHHEAAHAVADYLLGIDIGCFYIIELKTKEWEGACMPLLGDRCLKVLCIVLSAGMFGCQLAEGKKKLEIPFSYSELQRYGALLSDYSCARQMCVTMIANRTEGWIEEAVSCQNPDIKSQYDKQEKQCLIAADELLNDLMGFAMFLIWNNRQHIIELAELLLGQRLEGVKWPQHCIEDYKNSTSSIQMLSGGKVKSHLAGKGLVFGSEIKAVENILYPQGYTKEIQN